MVPGTADIHQIRAAAHTDNNLEDNREEALLRVVRDTLDNCTFGMEPRGEARKSEIGVSRLYAALAYYYGRHFLHRSFCSFGDNLSNCPG